MGTEKRAASLRNSEKLWSKFLWAKPEGPTLIAAHTSSAALPSRSHTTMAAPWEASSLAVASPMPLPAPVRVLRHAGAMQASALISPKSANAKEPLMAEAAMEERAPRGI
jgi:hypothetical protein